MAYDACMMEHTMRCMYTVLNYRICTQKYPTVYCAIVINIEKVAGIVIMGLERSWYGGAFETWRCPLPACSVAIYIINLARETCSFRCCHRVCRCWPGLYSSCSCCCFADAVVKDAISLFEGPRDDDPAERIDSPVCGHPYNNHHRVTMRRLLNNK